jgi:hypothetical protein
MDLNRTRSSQRYISTLTWKETQTHVTHTVRNKGLLKDKLCTKTCVDEWNTCLKVTFVSNFDFVMSVDSEIENLLD